MPSSGTVYSFLSQAQTTYSNSDKQLYDVFVEFVLIYPTGMKRKVFLFLCDNENTGPSFTTLGASI